MQAEGGAMCLVCVAIVWWLLSAVAASRYAMYSMLMAVPMCVYGVRV